MSRTMNEYVIPVKPCNTLVLPYELNSELVILVEPEVGLTMAVYLDKLSLMPYCSFLFYL